jgi:hypothetical protein
MQLRIFPQVKLKPKRTMRIFAAKNKQDAEANGRNISRKSVKRRIKTIAILILRA